MNLQFQDNFILFFFKIILIFLIKKFIFLHFKKTYFNWKTIVYNVVLVSAIQQCELDISKYMFSPS